MIKIAGSAQRSFIFPAELPMAYAYYSDLGRILNYLPHICLVQTYTYDRFRVLYNTLELGAYHIRIFCDLQAVMGGDKEQVLRIHPLQGVKPIKPESGLNTTTTQGVFSMESVFGDKGAQTQIDYNLQLEAKLPTPLGLRLVPGGVVDSIAESIMEMRIHEIAEGFVDRSIEAFPHWLAELEKPKRSLE